jgi:outer membrane protein TolC
LAFAAEAGVWKLDQAIQYALEHNPQYRSAQYQQNVAKSQKREAITGLLPTLSASASYTRLGQVPTLSFPNPAGPALEFEVGRADNYLYQLSLQQPLFTGGALTQSVRAAGAMEKAGGARLFKAKQDLVLSVKKSYYGVLKTQWLCMIADTSVKQLEALTGQSLSMYRSGMLAEADYLRVKAQLSSTRLFQLQARNGLQASKDAFKNILGLESDTGAVEIPAEILQKELPQVTRETLLRLARGKDPDLRALKLQADAAAMRVNMERSRYWPSIFAVGNYQWKQPNTANEENLEDSWNLTLAAQMTLWNWTASQQKVFQAKMQSQQAQEGLKAVRQGIDLKVSLLFDQYLEKDERVRVSAEGLSASERAYGLSLDRYRLGNITNTEMLDAQRQLMQAKSDHYGALADRETAWAELGYLMEE